MQRRSFLIFLAGGLATAMPAFASFSDDVVAQLTQQGFQNISVQTTWLGRVRILAYRDGGMREIVLNPRTGEILRDLWTASDGTVRGASIVDDVDSSDDNSGSGSHGSDDNGSDDDGSDDHSGSGGGDDDNSGSGSGSSGSGKDDDGKDDDGRDDDKGGKGRGKDD